jgi:hypothetical protein
VWRWVVNNNELNCCWALLLGERRMGKEKSSKEMALALQLKVIINNTK